MNQTVVVCCCDSITKDYIISDLNTLNPNMDILVVNNEKELAVLLAKYRNITVYLDKFVLGFFLKEEFSKLKAINPEAFFVYVETGECPVFFGLRIHNIGINSFICGIENIKNVKKPFLMTFQQIEYYPEAVQKAFKDIYFTKDRHLYSEVTPKEYQIAIFIVKGLSLKEISAKSDNIALGTVSKHNSRLKNKTGSKSLRDFIYLLHYTKLNHLVI